MNLPSTLAALATAALATAALALPALASTPVKHVVVVVFENTDYDDAMAQPFFAKLAKEGANLTSIRAEKHPSQPNYVAMTAGDTFGVSGDGDVDLDVTHIGDLLEAKGKTWKVYAENWPGHCFTGSSKGRYVRKHVPFVSYQNVVDDAARCAKIVDAGQLKKDIAAGTLPDYAYYVPNLDNDGHDTGVEYADQWYSGAFKPLLSNPKFTDGLMLVSTFDESGGNSDNQIYTSFWGPTVKAGTEVSADTDHYGVLRTIEDALDIGTLGRKDEAAAPLTGWAN